MNLFATHDCPIMSAQDHCDTHCLKMCVEVNQLLSTAHVVLDGVQLAYKKTHQNHPSAVWVRQSSGNYQWAYEHYVALCKEYEFRTGKVHKSSEHIDVLKNLPKNIPIGDRTEFAMAMPDEFKKHAIFGSPCAAYRNYLSVKFSEWQTRTDKRQIVAAWTKRNAPEWFKN